MCCASSTEISKKIKECLAQGQINSFRLVFIDNLLYDFFAEAGDLLFNSKVNGKENICVVDGALKIEDKAM